jgi:hypothetical protein
MNLMWTLASLALFLAYSMALGEVYSGYFEALLRQVNRVAASATAQV